MWSWRWEREEGSGIEARVARRNKWVDWRSRRMVDGGWWIADGGRWIMEGEASTASVGLRQCGWCNSVFPLCLDSD